MQPTVSDIKYFGFLLEIEDYKGKANYEWKHHNVELFHEYECRGEHKIAYLKAFTQVQQVF